ncbi:CCR4-NOT transcription complex subunit 1, partial [Nymphaea thermarum]
FFCASAVYCISVISKCAISFIFYHTHFHVDSSCMCMGFWHMKNGLMIAVIPFTSKILEPCQSSLAYQPPNPWKMGILGLLAEIYALPNLKMNLKFDVEVLFKNLGVEMKDARSTSLLKNRVREVEGNPGFSNKDLGASQQQVVADLSTGIIPPLGQVDLQPEVVIPPHPCSHSICWFASPFIKHIGGG